MLGEAINDSFEAGFQSQIFEVKTPLITNSIKQHFPEEEESKHDEIENEVESKSLYQLKLISHQDLVLMNQETPEVWQFDFCELP